MTAATVLVVDDDRSLVDVIGQYLRGEGYRVLAAHDGVEALRLWREASPDLIILDWMLPGLSGLEVVRVQGDGVKGRVQTQVWGA